MKALGWQKKRRSPVKRRPFFPRFFSLDFTGILRKSSQIRVNVLSQIITIQFLQFHSSARRSTFLKLTVEKYFSQNVAKRSNFISKIDCKFFLPKKKTEKIFFRKKKSNRIDTISVKHTNLPLCVSVFKRPLSCSTRRVPDREGRYVCWNVCVRVVCLCCVVSEGDLMRERKHRARSERRASLCLALFSNV